MAHLLEMLRSIRAEKESWIEVRETQTGVFSIVGDNMTNRNGNSITDITELGFIEWDNEVTDLDKGQSDESQCFGMSEKLKWRDVELTPTEIRAPSLELLKEALTHVIICAWCPGDI
jgi:hypothetical protein